MTAPAARPFVIISDAQAFGDDGGALALLLAHPGIDVALIVAESGNVWAEDAHANLRGILTQLNRTDIPVCTGLSAQVYNERLASFRAQAHAGLKTTYAGAFGTPLPAVSAEDGRRRLQETIRKAAPVDLILIAPASTLADAVLTDPVLVQGIRQVYVMGGAVDAPGNTTAKAEFNFWFDPAAADRLLASGLTITLLPLDATEGITYPPSLYHRLDRGPSAAYLAAYLASRPGKPRPMWDEVLIAAMLHPQLIARQTDMILAVNTKPDAYYGSCRRMDAASGRRPVQVIQKIDRDALMTMFERLFTS